MNYSKSEIIRLNEDAKAIRVITKEVLKMNAENTKQKINVIHCMLTDAIESNYIGYWAIVRNVKRTKNGDIYQFECRDSDGNEESEANSLPWRTVNDSGIAHAVKQMLSGEVKVGRDVAASFIGKEEDWDYDCISADCAIQIAAFGSVVFG